MNGESDRTVTASEYTESGTPFAYCMINNTNAWLYVVYYNPATRACHVMNYAKAPVSGTITIRVLFK